MGEEGERKLAAIELPRARRLHRRLELAAALLVGLFLPGRFLSPRSEPKAPVLPPQLQPPTGTQLEQLSLVDLRQIRGVGPARARAIRQALWRNGPLTWELGNRSGGGLKTLKDIPGVGEKTAARIESWLDAHGLPPAVRPADAPRPGPSSPDLHPSEPRKSPRNHHSE